jgi:hypothetical protein
MLRASGSNVAQMFVELTVSTLTESEYWSMGHIIRPPWFGLWVHYAEYLYHQRIIIVDYALCVLSV